MPIPTDELKVARSLLQEVVAGTRSHSPVAIASVGVTLCDGVELLEQMLERAQRQYHQLSDAYTRLEQLYDVAIEAKQIPTPTCDGPRVPLEVAEGHARRIARLLDKSAPKGWRFGMIYFTEKAEFLSWISNAAREDMAKALGEMLERWARAEPSI